MTRTRMASLLGLLAASGCLDASDPRDPTRDDASSGADGKADGPLDDGDTDGSSEEVAVDPAEIGWDPIGFGVTYQQIPGALGNEVLIVYGGYTAKLEYSQSWAQELYRRRLRDLGVRHLYAVQGPAQASYAGREIGNSKLAAHLVSYAEGTDAIHIVAHSSGAFVAHELLRQVTVGSLDPHGVTSGRIAYYNLDGGGSGFSTTQAEHLMHLAFVYARAGASLSANASSMTWQASTYAGSDLVEIDASGSGCNAGAKWCLHDAIIISRPHNPSMFDLRRDYQEFSPSRRVVTEYFVP